MGELLDQLFDGGPPIATIEEIKRWRDTTAEYLASLKRHGRVVLEEDHIEIDGRSFEINGVHFPGTARPSLWVRNPMPPDRLKAAIADGESWLETITAEIQRREADK